MGDFYAIITAVCWSSAVIFFDISSKSFSAIQLNVIKNSIGVFGFLVTILIFSIPIPNFTSHDIYVLIFSGILGIFIADLLFLESLKKIGSSLSALVSTIYTPSIFIIAFLLFKEIITPQAYAGGGLVIIGISIIVYEIPKNLNTKVMYVGLFFGLLAHVITAYSVLIIRPILNEHSILFVALYRFSVGLLGAIILSIFKMGIKDLLASYRKGLSSLSLLLGSFLGTYLSVIFWLAGYKYTLAGRAAIYNQLSTVFIVLMARFFLKEKLSKRKVFGITIAIAGAVVVSISN